MTAAETQLEESPRVAGLGSLAGFAVVLVSLLALVFPTGREYAELTAVTKPDAYSVAYLEVLTRANPKEAELKLVYARQLGMLGRYDDAIVALEPVIDRPSVKTAAKNLNLDLTLARARGIPEGDPSRLASLQIVLRQLHECATFPQTAERNEALAVLALELGDPRLAAQLYLTVAAQRPKDSGRLFALAARWLRAGGENTQAAAYYQVAVTAAHTPEEAREFAASAVQSLEADSKVVPAADLAAKYAQQFPTDAVILALATRLATACSRLAEARAFGRRVLAITPDDEAILRSQTMRELAAQDPRSAMVLLNKLLTKHPEDYDLRILRARTAEWTGDLEVAKRDLLWLIAHPQKKGAAPPS